jgi:hypothetical protein
MPTGPAHDHVVNSIVNGEYTQEITPCRCTIGENHFDGPWPGDDQPEPEGNSFAGAEEIFDSSGRDEDYDFR